MAASTLAKLAATSSWVGLSRYKHKHEHMGLESSYQSSPTVGVTLIEFRKPLNRQKIVLILLKLISTQISALPDEIKVSWIL